MRFINLTVKRWRVKHGSYERWKFQKVALQHHEKSLTLTDLRFDDEPLRYYFQAEMFYDR